MGSICFRSIPARSTSGDTYLGGDDWDERIVQWIADEFKKDQGIDLSQDSMALQRLKEAAEKSTMELSTLVKILNSSATRAS